MTEHRPQKLTTFLMFEGRAEEAMTLYTSLFADSRVLSLTRYGPNEEGAEGSVRHATFSLAGQQFMGIDSYVSHEFSFTPATSIYVRCEDAEEIERLYTELSKDGGELMPPGDYGFSTKFGWLNDRSASPGSSIWADEVDTSADVGAVERASHGAVRRSRVPAG